MEISHVSTLGGLSVAFAENCGFKHGSVTVKNIFAHVALSLSNPQVYVIKERCRFSQINFFIEYFHIGPRFCLFPANLMSSANRVKNYPFWWCTDRQRPGSSPSMTANWMKRKRRQKGLIRRKKGSRINRWKRRTTRRSRRRPVNMQGREVGVRDDASSVKKEREKKLKSEGKCKLSRLSVSPHRTQTCK